MSKKIAAICGILALALTIIVAVIAYDRLSERAESPDNLVIVDWENADLPSNLPDGLAETNDPPEALPHNLPEDYAEANNEEYLPQAPDFVMYDIYGNEVHLSDFFGKPIVLNFWTTWCPSCIQEMPYFEQLNRESGDQIHILKVNLLDGQRETRERVDRFIADNDYNFPIFFDAGEGGREYGVRYIPVTFFIDAAGHVVAHAQGAVNEDILRRGLKMLGINMY